MAQTRRARLTEGTVGRTLFRLTVPMIFGMVGMVIFNMTDTYFIGRLGTSELAALSFTFPVILVIHSLALGLGIGASAVISKAIGEGNHDKVKRLTTDSLVLSILFVGFFVLAGSLTIYPLFRLLGAPDNILPLINKYMQIWYFGVIFVIVPMVGNNAIRASGDMKTPAIVMMIAAGINMILDPLLIFGIGPFPRLEIAGAAIATVIGRGITLVITLIILIHREKMITFQIPPFKKIYHSWKEILYVGIPTAGTRIIIPLGIGIITRFVSAFGAPAVAAFGVSSRIEFFTMAVIMALSSVISPFVGQNWGAGKLERVDTGVRLSQLFSIGWGIFVFLLLAVFARSIAGIFNSDPAVISSAALYMRIVPGGYGMYGVTVIVASTLNVLRKPLQAAGLSVLQMFVLTIPMAYYGSTLFGLPGIFGSLAVSYAVTGILSWFLFRKVRKNQRVVQIALSTEE
jgi:putative MATE family efflux protein